MTTNALQLLRQLGSGIRPDAIGAGAPASVGSSAFADLMRQAQNGTLSSTAPVEVAGDAGVSCSDEQLARLSLGADKLEAAGVRTALVTIDGQRLIMDVHARQITGSATAENGVVSGIDGMMDLGDARAGGAPAASPATSATSATMPAGLAQNQSLMKLLAGLSAG